MNLIAKILSLFTWLFTSVKQDSSVMTAPNPEPQIEEPKEEKMRSVVIVRTTEIKEETLGNLYVYDGQNQIFDCVTLELPWRDNQRNVSRVPAGEYDLVLEWSPKFSMMLWELKGVPNRSECKFHAANYVRQLNGCIAPGLAHQDIDGDGLPDVVNSYATLMRFHDSMGRGNRAKLTIIDVNQ